MHPVSFEAKEDAVRWARHGGTALHRSACGQSAALYAHPVAGESYQWAMYWAGKSGVTIAALLNRGTHEQCIALTPGEADRVQIECGRKSPPTLLSTVVYFTGTRKGPTEPQITALREFLFERQVVEAHDGLCVGADEVFHTMMHESSYLMQPRLVGHPAEVPPELTCADRVHCDYVHSKQAPLTRNVTMAKQAAYAISRGARVELVACPAEAAPPKSGRGGTWHAIRVFHQERVPVTIIRPDGSLTNVETNSLDL